MTYTYDETTKRWIITLTGDIDVFKAPELKQLLLDRAEEKHCDILIDASGLSYIDSTGLGALVSGLNKAREYGAAITIKGLSSHIKRLFVITALDAVFKFED